MYDNMNAPLSTLGCNCKNIHYLYKTIKGCKARSKSFNCLKSGESFSFLIHIYVLSFAGSTRNIYFPFDIVDNTPMDVTTEMGKIDAKFYFFNHLL